MPTADLGPLEQFAENTPTKASGGGRDFVVVRRGEGAFVLDHECQHLGAPLSKGHIDGDTLVCPWHRATFALTDGALLEPPGLNCQRAYATSLEDGALIVAWDEAAEPHPAPDMTSTQTDPRHAVVLGAGAAGITAAESLRAFGFGGELTLIDREPAAPYDRTKLSKGVTEDADAVRFRTDAWLSQHEVAVRHEAVKSVDPHTRTVTLEDDETLTADILIIAPGSEPNRLPIPGADSPRVMTLRSVDDALALSSAIAGTKRAAIIGSGFIGLEAATVLSGQGVKVTVIGQSDVPFAKLLGERVGARLKREQEEGGVSFVQGDVAEIEVDEDMPRAVLMKDETRITADLVVMAVGVRPRSAILSGVEAEKDGGVTVNPDLSLPGCEGVYLAGDIARVPTAWGPIRVEHWRFAQQLGRLAAKAVVTEDAKYDGTPFFWSKQQANGSYVYLGHAEDWDDIVYEGDADRGADFAAYYLKDGKVMAVFGHGLTDKLSGLERRMSREGPLPREAAPA